jgi:DUF4097 and DUF4098 domain-containing protein YvlB
MPEFDHSTPVTVALKAQRGKIDVTAEDRVSVLVEIVPLDGSEHSRKAAEDTVVTLEGDTLAIRSPEGSGWQWRRSANLLYTVKVPADSSLAIRSASADLRAVGRYRDADADLQSGDVYVQDLTGDGNLRTASGDLTASTVGGSLRAKSSSGDLRIGDVTHDVSLETASGDITMRSCGGSVRAGTASGDIEIGVVHQGRTSVTSASGDIEIGVAAGTGVWLDVSTASGSTRNELTMGDNTPGAATGATLELHLRTASGDIKINRVTGAFPAAA